MPIGIKLISLLGVIGGLFTLFICLIPQGQIQQMFGLPVSMTTVQLWSTGYVILFLAYAIGCVATSIGIIKRASVARFAIMFYVLLPYFIGRGSFTVSFQPPYQIWGIVLEAMVNFFLPLVVLYWYLFKKQSVVKYFRETAG